MNSILSNLPWTKPKTDFERLAEQSHVPKQMEFVTLWADDVHALIEKVNELPSQDGGKLVRVTDWFCAGN